MRETWFDSWVGKINYRKESLPTPVFCPGAFPGLYSPWSRKESDLTEWLSLSGVNINVLGISELKWTWADKSNSDDHYIYYYGQESLRRNGVALTVNKSTKCSTWLQTQKWQNDLSSFARQTIQYHSNPSPCPNQVMLKKLTLNSSMKTYKTF